MYAGAGELISIYNDPQIKQVSTVPAIITLPMGYTLERFFLLSPTITANRALALSQTTRARKVKIKFSADAGVVLTLPANWVMSYANFDDATKELTLLDAGAFELSAWFDGTNWNAELNGPDNT